MTANSSQRNRFTTTVARELLVGVTGIILVLFILGHLSGNMLLYVGPEAFNAYAHQLAALGPLLWAIRLGMIAALVAHVYTTIRLKLEGRAARGGGYEVEANIGRKTMATRFMIYTGLLVLFFLFLHLYDFTFGEKEGPGTIVAGMAGGDELELYGLVWNTFAEPWHALLYIAAVCCVGLHLSHAISSVLVTLGVLSEKATPKADLLAYLVGAVVALGFASIPVWVLVKTFIIGVQA